LQKHKFKHTIVVIMNTQPYTQRINILGVPFDNVSKEEALSLVVNQLQKGTKHFFVATPNPEMLLAARKNEKFLHTLNHTSLNIADGFGIILAAKFNRTPLKQRITGVDFMKAICEKAPQDTKVFLLGAAPGVAEKTAEKLEKLYPNIQVTGTHSGSSNQNEETHICELIDKSEATLLFVAFGAPKQELWLERNLPHLKHIKVAMGIGGAFDFISGTIKRAPIWMQKLGIEWLYRLIKQPSRIGRIFNATIKFPIVFLLSKLQKNKKT
jgi:N-acetylglucosaminyldiphosphoundecaprenol N-acetyl-beta-D-mannosaminyltransferase